MPIPPEIIINSMQSILNRIPSGYYADVLFDRNSMLTISKSISDETVSVLPKLVGYVFRLFDGKVWWEIADLDPGQLEKRVEKLVKNTNKSGDIDLKSFPGQKLDINFPMKKDLTKIPLNEKISYIRSVYNDLQKTDRRVINPRVSYRDSISERVFMNTEGSLLRQVIPRSRILIMPIVKEGQNIEYDYFITNREAGFEVVDTITPEIIENTVKNAIHLTQAKLAPAGTMSVLLDPAMSGLIAHESMGHGLEADQLIRDRSYLKEFFQKKVASSLVNISDSPLEPQAVGSYAFDDEGILAQKTKLVENGLFTHVLHTRLSASIMHETPCGNGRRQSYRHPIYPRMSNTYFEPGDCSIEEMIRDMKSGIVLEKANFGMEDPLGGGMQVASKYGYLVERGEKTQLVKAVTLSGSVLNFLNHIDAISKGPIELDGGQCGKGVEDHVHVTTGGVWIRSQQGIVGPG